MQMTYSKLIQAQNKILHFFIFTFFPERLFTNEQLRGGGGEGGAEQRAVEGSSAEHVSLKI